ncbi:MAG: vitamin B12 dependent-methionine synthase activation domain-containing protein [Acidaminococcus sp.]|uniref:vitamin B12 dependent-methionine synthase activation domain-containing protein n=1 Tax=Acidaminococcus sp. TaxID=1872103 RepID=UPI0026DF449A|nr:vitamin B12 dependent-methionine synthase activation domain-containing protein [Acidaminococcus sp.]MDO5597626.1 vitamin B12 dependent-methionine synthase activation domain-containing protein [Acidaminococcus sp.]
MAVRIPFDEKEALRYFGARPGDERAMVTVDRAFLQLRNEVQPRSILQQWSCTVVQGAGPEKGRVILENGTEFVSSGLARHLMGCDRLLLFGATLGTRVDIALRRISVRSIAEGAAAQAVAASLIESYLDQQEIVWKKDLPAAWQYRTRFSPGYGDWDLAEQQKIFRLLDCAKTIGLTLTAGGIMAPTKSVTAVIGIDRFGKPPFETEESRCGKKTKCAACGNITCPFRQEEP